MCRLPSSALPFHVNNHRVAKLPAAFESVADAPRLFRSIYVYLPGIIGILLAAGMIEIPGWGRKWTLVFGALVQGVAMAMYTQVDTITAKVGLNALEYM